MAAITLTASGATRSKAQGGNLRFACGIGNLTNSPYTITGIATEDELVAVWVTGTGADPVATINHTANASITAANTVKVVKDLDSTAHSIHVLYIDNSL